MLSQKSIRGRFIAQLTITLMIMVVLLSIIIYNIIKINIYQSQVDEMIAYAKTIINQNHTEQSSHKKYTFDIKRQSLEDLKVNTAYKVIRVKDKHKYFTEQYTKNNETYLRLFYPYKLTKPFIISEENLFIVLKKNITIAVQTIDKIFINIISTAFIVIVLIIFYALFLSRIQLLSIEILNKKIQKLNENFLEPISDEGLPKELSMVAKNINSLTSRISNFTSNQKELFVGIAHELKTPLAIIKSSNDVTLLKTRDTQRYINTLKEHNNIIDRMNKMINSILQIGRQEGAQLEKAEEIDVIDFIKKRSSNFVFLCSDGKKIQTSLNPQSLIIKIQPTLLLHILQNFVQNALKFSPNNSTIHINTYIKDDFLYIEVLDNGDGIDENMNLFAPFKRYGDKGGAGLGLFLAHGAAKAMNAHISIKNRKDTKGCKATLKIKLENNNGKKNCNN